MKQYQSTKSHHLYNCQNSFLTPLEQLHMLQSSYNLVMFRNLNQMLNTLKCKTNWFSKQF